MRKLASFFTLIVLFAISPFTVRVAQEGSVAPPGNQVLELQLNSTLWGIRQALASQPGTYIMSNAKDCYLFIWQIKDAWAFAGINVSKAEAMNLLDIGAGNIVNATTMNDVVKSLEGKGWQVVPSAALPHATRIVISASLDFASTSLPTFLVLPAGVFATPEQLKDYQLYEVWQ